MIHPLRIELSDDQLNRLMDGLADRITERLGPAPPAPESDPLLTVAQTCGRLSVSRTKLWTMRRAGKLQAVNLGRAVRFRSSDVEALIEQPT